MALQLPDSMPWRIYRAYCQGPGALLRLFEDAFGRHALYGTPDPDQQQRTIDALSEQVGQLKTQNERLRAEASDLRGHNFQLQRRNAELESLVTRDSHNLSRSPSTDPPLAKRTKSLQRPSGKRPGAGQASWGDAMALSTSQPCCRALAKRVSQLPCTVRLGSALRPPPPAGGRDRASSLEGD